MPCKAFMMEISALVRRFYDDLWNRWDDESLESVLAHDFQFRGSLGVETHGRDGWRQYRELVRTGSSDFFNDIQLLVVQGERAAARLNYSGTHTGPLAGLPPTGRRFSYAGAAFFSMRDEHLSTAWVLGDLSALRGQLS